MLNQNLNINRDATKEQIRSRLDIVDVVGRYVALKPAGQNMKARCPFHNEKTPSFTVNPARQIFHCFGCGKGGDVFTFLMEIEGLTFGEVMRRTAEETGVKLDTRFSDERPQTGSGGITKETALKIHHLAAGYYYDTMKNSDQAKQYFKKRGLTAETVRDFKLGYATDAWDGFVSYAVSKGVSHDALAASGLALARSDGSSYDRFRDRIMFPICDIAGRTIAFGGRTMQADAEPKYLNSPETILYHKNRTLYGLHKSRQAIKEKGGALLVEGYMDYLSLYQAGIRNVVAVSGTALTEEHGRLLKRFCGRVVLLFDGDEAGRKAAERAVYLLAPAGLDVRVHILPAEHDPDTWVAAAGAESVLDALAAAQTGLTFAIDRAASVHGIDTAQAKSQVINRVAPLVAAANDPIVASEYAREIAERTGVREQFVYQAARKQHSPSSPLPSGAPAGPRYTASTEGNIISLLVHHPALVDTALERISPETFTDRFSKDLYSLIITTYATDAALVSLMDRTADPEQKRILAAVMMEPPTAADPTEELAHAIARLESKHLKSRMRDISARLKSGCTESQRSGLLAQQQDIARRLRELGA